MLAEDLSPTRPTEDARPRGWGTDQCVADRPTVGGIEGPLHHDWPVFRQAAGPLLGNGNSGCGLQTQGNDAQAE